MRFNIGIDLGGTNIRAALFEENRGNLTLLSSQKRTLKNIKPQSVVSELTKIINTFKPENSKISGIGIGVAGMVSSISRVIKRAPNLDWTDFPLGQEIFNKTDIPTWVLNDLNAICWGEFIFNPDISDSLLAVYLGTGVGGALIMQGELIEGAGGMAGEIGHTKVNISNNARSCGCGKTGCIEAYLGGKNFSKWMEELKTSKKPHDPVFSNIKGELHPGKIDSAAQTGDPLALSIVNQTSTYLGMVLANAVTLNDPGTILLGGTVWDGSPLLQKKTVQVYERLVNPLSKAKIVSGTLGDLAGLYGAAHKSFLEQENK